MMVVSNSALQIRNFHTQKYTYWKQKMEENIEQFVDWFFGEYDEPVKAAEAARKYGVKTDTVIKWARNSEELEVEKQKNAWVIFKA